MTQSPYANPHWLDLDEEQPATTSSLAVASVVCGLGGVLICLPFVFPILGLILGAAALAVMTGSSRKLTGAKFAVAGLILSALFLVLHTYGAMFLYRWAQQPAQGAHVFLTTLEQQDYAAAHDMLTPDAAGEVDQGDLAALGERLTQTYGPLVDVEIDFQGNALTHPLPGGETMIGFETSTGDFPPLPLTLRFRDDAIAAAVKADGNPNKSPGAVPVRIDWIAFLEPDVGLWTFPAGKMPAGVAMRLNNTSWYICRDRGRTPEEYAKALKMAEQACAIEPSGTYLNTLGVAQYRMGLYDEALKTLERCDKLNGGIPADIAFLAMLYHHQGDEARARRELQRLREVMGSSRRHQDPESRMFLEEATRLIEGAGG
jgi:tetratricopeptide (TPR) repeat protein